MRTYLRVNLATPTYTEIGWWSEVKIEILRAYATEYSKIMASQRGTIRRWLYIDGFAGAGVHLSRETGELVQGSPLSALSIRPPFTEYHFVDLEQSRVEALRSLTSNRNDVHIYEGDCNEVLPGKVFGRARYEDYARALCLLDPYGLHLDWKVVETAGKMGSIEIFLNFPMMDINMNVLKHDRERVDPRQAERMNRFWGDDSWIEPAYSSPQLNIFGDAEKAGNEAVVAAYRDRLRRIAGFKFVPPPMPMRNSANSVVYYLFFASRNAVGPKIVEHVFNKYRNRMGD
jgi:three-Cys-motif partner protein